MQLKRQYEELLQGCALHVFTKALLICDEPKMDHTRGYSASVPELVECRARGSLDPWRFPLLYCIWLLGHVLCEETGETLEALQDHARASSRLQLEQSPPTPHTQLRNDYKDLEYVCPSAPSFSEHSIHYSLYSMKFRSKQFAHHRHIPTSVEFITRGLPIPMQINA